MQRPYPRYFRYFVDGMYDELFAHLGDYQGEERDYIHLYTSNGDWWAVIRRRTSRSGVVLWSNFLKPNSVVHCKCGWAYGRCRRSWNTLDTVLDPRRLAVFYVPPKYVPLSSLRHAC